MRQRTKRAELLQALVGLKDKHDRSGLIRHHPTPPLPSCFRGWGYYSTRADGVYIKLVDVIGSTGHLLLVSIPEFGPNISRGLMSAL